MRNRNIQRQLKINNYMMWKLNLQSAGTLFSTLLFSGRWYTLFCPLKERCLVFFSGRWCTLPEEQRCLVLFSVSWLSICSSSFCWFMIDQTLCVCVCVCLCTCVSLASDSLETVEFIVTLGMVTASDIGMRHVLIIFKFTLTFIQGHTDRD